MLDHLREEAQPVMWGIFGHLLSEASKHLKILDPKRGDKELVKAVAVELAKLSRG